MGDFGKGRPAAPSFFLIRRAGFQARKNMFCIVGIRCIRLYLYQWYECDTGWVSVTPISTVSLTMHQRMWWINIDRGMVKYRFVGETKWTWASDVSMTPGNGERWKSGRLVQMTARCCHGHVPFVVRHSHPCTTMIECGVRCRNYISSYYWLEYLGWLSCEGRPMFVTHIASVYTITSCSPPPKANHPCPQTKRPLILAVVLATFLVANKLWWKTWSSVNSWSAWKLT